ncbi:MAG TPA: ABC transporter permease [Puia sp.]|jgi:putative ABC transport system permease protein|nr:ABC transporter permease [Puia sp.]
MLKNYFKIAIRSLTRNKAFSFINIFGLAVGLATCLLIMLYIFDESSYDQHHKDGDRLFRIASVSGKGETWAADPAPMAWALKNDLPEVEQATRLMTFPDIEKMLLKYKNQSENKQFFETNGYYVDSTFFQLFTYDFIYGNAATALEEPNTMVLSEQLAGKFFGKENPVGKAMQVVTPFGEFNYTVKGVFDNTKHKSHIPANYFLSMRNKDMWNWVQNQTSWTTNNIFFTYVKLKGSASQASFERKLKPFFESHAGEGMKAAGFSKSLFIQPVKSIYLHSSIGNEIAPNGNITYLYILGSIAAFILMIACINFMNLSTARSQKRAKEVGIRKVIGAEKSSLIRQFLGESFLMCLIALGFALILVWMLLPLFNNLTHKNMHPLDEPVLLWWAVGLTLLTGLLAGLYPAFYLSAFKPVSVLKGKITNNFSAAAIRKGLVVFQFTVSICLVSGAIIIWKQLNLLKNQDLGFNKNRQIILPLEQGYLNSEAKYTPLKNELLKIPGVKAVTSGSAYPGLPNLNDMLFYAEGKSVSDVVDVHLSSIENDYIRDLGIKLLSGRSFSKEFRADSAGIILNEEAVKQLGYTVENAVGKKVQYDFNGHSTLQIVGVVKNFNFESLHESIKPFGFTTGIFSNKYGYLIASITTNDYTGLLSELEKSWTKLNPETPFVYFFPDQDFQRQYEREQRTASLVMYFTLIAILIACLGLFGLAAFSAEQRTKEIGIRKVLGASVTNVTLLLSKDFVSLVIIAILIASPLAWWGMNKWLQDFAYRIEISWWMLLAAGLLAILIAVLTISFQAIKAALADPAKSLRTE